MKVLLIETGNARHEPFAQCWYNEDKTRFAVPLLALPVLAAIMPAEWDIQIIDEKVHDIDLSVKADLVCFSFKTKDAKRTYEYADRYRSQGTTVVLGGVHATLMPEEASAHADAVVIGEAEGVWHEIQKDLSAGALKKSYRSPRATPLHSVPIPRFDLIDNPRYCVHAIQTARGCLVGCDFCPIQEMYGGKSKCKPVERVMKEVEAVLSIDANKNIFFVDEMFCGGQRGHQRELLAELRKNNVDFFCISDFKVIDPAYIWELARSGCRKLSINMPGTCLPQELQAVKAIQKLGIDVWGFFMFGFSFHTSDTFKRVVDFVHESGMRNITITVMSPFPNTTAARMAEKRSAIHSKEWEHYDQCHVVFTPEQMTAKQLEEGFHWAWAQLEDKLYIREEDFSRSTQSRSLRTVKRLSGAASLATEKAVARLLGKKEQPVDLQSIIGKKRAEVSITTHNTMG